ncbi:PEP-CTERM protein-sorting domain-containing protein [Andreprevotia lacus DSM 23236]|jgi:hypothetical protein|uniref:PEP-CTERM protein-sorting domain-containing protein n=1 Tax=Andreprevotia lacus DSM 23236 TaxID=1121001 RepID=A0A1W1XG95_9NEIS|nr:PEP-CTERM sorting domain-containing protein [Andreprevotia lacus]SMC23005.1 PEP-CTERM protein-sorting domain-containing protein [Andreprevotia lacus DSM 23236]
MRYIKHIVATVLLATASISEAAYSKAYTLGTGTLFAFDSFSTSSHSKLNFTATSGGGDLSQLFGLVFQITPAYQSQPLQSFTFAPGKNSFSGSFDLPGSGSYGYVFSVSRLGATFGSFNVNVAPVPEPETVALMGVGLIGVLLARRRKRL